MRKFLTFVLLLLAVFFFATWQYRLLMVLFIVLLNKPALKRLLPSSKHTYKALVGGLMVAIFVAIPNYHQRGRIQLHYLDDNGERVATPMLVYAINAVFPEEEVMNMGMKAAAVLPQEIAKSVGLGGRLIGDARKDFWSGKAMSFYSPYNKISLEGSNPGSAPIAQAYNTFLGTDYDPIYVTRPNDYDEDREYPLVCFCHGYLGNWELYNGLWCRLKDCIVVSIGTKDLSGIFSKGDIDRLFTKYIPNLESEGYRIDKEQIHLMGLSNGGTAADVAFRHFSGKLKSIVYMSTGCNVIKHAATKVLLIGGGKDVSSAGLPSAHKKLLSVGTPTSIMYDTEENHYLVCNKADEVINFLNKEMLGED